MKTITRPFLRVIVPMSVVAILAAAGTWLVVAPVDAEPSPKRSGARRAAANHPAESPDTARIRAEDLSRAFRDAAQSVLPAVVVIKMPHLRACPHCGGIHPPGHEQDPRVPGGAEDAPGVAPNVPLTVLGSGFLVDPSGLVLTNQHVVKGARQIVVQLADGRQFGVVRVKKDAEMDLAVLQLDAKTPLPATRLADSDAVEIGDWVLAIGCPLELEQTVSAGIISAKNRSFCPNHGARMLQTDAAINPGSSGGPLVDLNGRVVGITTSIASDDGGYQGIGFAIPANHAARLVQQFAADATTP